MIIDFDNLENRGVIESDLCIMGAGAAGITLARGYSGASTRVCVLESGGLDYNSDVQALAEGQNVGLPYYDLAAARLRFLGGTTNHWEGCCSALSSIDFETRPWVTYSGWPITKTDLDPYYPRAQEICQLGPYTSARDLWQELGLTEPEFLAERLSTMFWQFSPPTRFGTVYREELEKAKNITVILNANVTNLQATERGDHVTHLDLKALTGQVGQLRARYFVLCCGGLENARLLLASNGVISGGLGNEHGLVGRFFMEHPQVKCGIIASDEAYDLMDRYNRKTINGFQYLPGIVASESLQREHKILNCSAVLGYEAVPEDGTEAARKIWKDFKKYRMTGEVPNHLLEEVRRVMRNLDDVGYNVYRRYVLGKGVISPIKNLFLTARSEQAPNPDSRVFLRDDRDALGMRKIKLEWRLTELDKLTIRKVAEVVGSEFGRQNVGRVRIEEWLRSGDNGWPESIWQNGLTGQFHHMGTTRMADDPAKGVVDRNCKVHGISNLYVGGSSVFPTGGFTNPTLTIVALALRLGAYLRQQYAFAH